MNKELREDLESLINDQRTYTNNLFEATMKRIDDLESKEE